MKKIYTFYITFLLTISGFAQDVIHGEYFIDAETGFGSGQSFTISAPDSDIIQSFTIPYSDFPSPGLHFVFYRTLDNFGNWSITRRKVVEVDDASGVEEVIKVEYFFDTDDGFGTNSFELLTPFADSAWTFDIPYAQIPPAWTIADTLFIRVLESVKEDWSLTVLLDSSDVFNVTPQELETMAAVSVFPNPFMDFLTLTNLTTRQSEVRIFNESAELVWSRTGQNETVIRTADWASGIYVVLVRTPDGKVFQSKIVRQ